MIEVAKARSHFKRLFKTFDKFEVIIDNHVALSLSQNVFINVFIQAYKFYTKSLQKILQISLFIDHNLKIFLPQIINKFE